METKKYASKDLHAQRKKFFLIGLSLALAMVITAFEWTTPKRIKSRPHPEPIAQEVVLVSHITDFNTPTAPPIRKVEIKIEPKRQSPTEITTVPDDRNLSDPVPSIEPTEDLKSNPIEIPHKPEETDSILVIAERNPEPIDGYKAFYRAVGENLKYPKQAKRTGTEGQVIIQFVINKVGEPMDFQVLKGIGAGCDEEAIRVLAKSKWVPGRQRGQPVKVRMTLPVIFKLSN
jgi:periplasmic protein TonB